MKKVVKKFYVCPICNSQIDLVYPFSSNEWMSMHDGLIVLEDGAMCTPYEFWRWRTDPVWNNGYDLFNS